jgi:RNA polymerase sigma factor (TIGR02999 family)
MSGVTRLLEAIQHGDPKAADELLPLVYEELRKLAAAKMANEAAGNTLQPTALVHEAWLRLLGQNNSTFAGRAHFFAAAAKAMRRILIDVLPPCSPVSVVCAESPLGGRVSNGY